MVTFTIYPTVKHIVIYKIISNQRKNHVIYLITHDCCHRSVLHFYFAFFRNCFRLDMFAIENPSATDK